MREILKVHWSSTKSCMNLSFDFKLVWWAPLQVGSVTAICFTCFLIRCFVVSLKQLSTQTYVLRISFDALSKFETGAERIIFNPLYTHEVGDVGLL